MINGPIEPSQEVIDEFVGVSHGNHTRVVELLEQYPALATTTATWGETAIEAASQMGLRETADLLLAHGAPLDICTAAVFGMDDKVEEFIAADPTAAAAATGAHGIPVLYYPVIGGHKALAERLLEIGADINAGADGSTALHGAAWFDQPEMAAWLLANGANPDLPNYDGKTALQVAIDSNKPAVAAVLRG